MAEIRVIERTVNLSDLDHTDYLTGALRTSEGLAHQFKITAIRGDTPVALSGTVTGVFVRKGHGSDAVPLTGSTSGGAAYVTLNANCYLYTGKFELTIFVTANGSTVAVYNAEGNVDNTGGTSTVDPDSEITLSVADLIDDIEDAIASVPTPYAGELAAIAGTFSNTVSYDAGQYVWYNGALYQFTADHAAGSWVGTDAHTVVVTNDIDHLGDDISNYGNLFVPTLLAHEKNIFDGTQYGRYANTADGNNYTLHYAGYSTVRLAGTAARQKGVWLSLASMSLVSGKTYTLVAYTSDGLYGIPVYLVSESGGTVNTYATFVVNNKPTVFTAGSNIADAYLRFWFGSGSGTVNITGTYTFLICEGTHEFLDLVTPLYKFNDVYYSAYSRSHITDKALKADIFEGTQYTDQRSNGNLSTVRAGINGVKLTGTTTADTPMWVTRGAMTFDSTKTYTMCVMTEDGLNSVAFALRNNSSSVKYNNTDVTVQSNGQLVVFSPDSNLSEVYVTVYTTSATNITGTYYIYISEGAYTRESFFGMTYAHNPEVDSVTHDLWYSAASRSIISDKALAADMFEGTQYTGQNTNGGVTNVRDGINAVKLTGTAAASTYIYISKAEMNLDSSKYYTMYVATDDGNKSLNLYLQNSGGQVQSGGKNVYARCDGRPVVFKPDASKSNVYVNLYTGSATVVTGTYYIYVCEGAFTNEEFFGNVSVIYDDELNVRQEIRDNNMFGLIRYDNVTNTQNGGNITIYKKGKAGVYLEGTAKENTGMWISPPDMSFEAGKTYTAAVISPDVIGKARINVWMLGVQQNETNVSIYVNDDVKVFTPDSDGSSIYCLIWTDGVDGNTVDVTGTYYIYIVEGEYTNEEFFYVKDATERVVPARYSRANIYGNYYSGLPVLYLEGDIKSATKDVEKNITYLYRDRTTLHQGTGNIKWQGSSSLTYPKKNYTINSITPAITFLNWGSRSKFVLKANYIDATHARNVCCAKLWGQIVKSRTTQNPNLYNLPNGGAVDGFPIMLFLNGNYNGLYTLNTSKDENMFGMNPSSSTAFIFGAEAHTDATRFKATTTLAEVEAGSTFTVEYAPDEDNIGWAVDSLNVLLDACINAHDEAAYRAICTNYIDIDSAIDYLLFVSLIGGTDVWDKNYLLATFDGTKWFMSAYDLDTTFGNHWTGTSYYAPNVEPDYNYLTYWSEQTATNQRLFYLINKYDKDAVITRFNQLLAGPMSEENVLNTISNFMVDIPLVLKMKDAEIWPRLPGTDTSSLAQIINWYRARLALIKTQIVGQGFIDDGEGNITIL